MQSPIATGFLRGKDLILEVCNAALLEIWQKDASILGLPLSEALPEIRSYDSLKLLMQVYDTGKSYHASGYKTKIQPDMYLDFAYTPLKDENDGVTGVMITASNVTEEFKARKQLEETDSSLREALELAELATWSINPVTGAIWYSDTMKQWIGVPEDERDFEAGMNPIPETDRERIRLALELAMKPESGGKYDEEHPIVNFQTGRIRTIHARARVYFDTDDKPYKMVGTAHDVTVQRSTQLALELLVQERTEELDASNEELQATNEELQVINEELASLNQNLLESNEALQQFAHVASHDLKEPLRKIRTFLGRIESDPKTLISEDSKPFLSRVYIAADRMAAMISGVLTYSSVNASQEPTQHIDLQEVLQEITIDLEVLTAQKNAVIKYDHLPNLEGAKVLIYQLFYNLLMNALKFSRPDKPPEITITSETVTQHGERFALITVADNGIGFDSSQSENIFNTFTRLNSKDKYEGTGLGLSLCKKIVSRHGGTITASGKPDEGAQFTLLLPLIQSQASI